MTPILRVRKRDRIAAWLTLDMRDDEDVGTVVVIPLFGPNHHSGMDCWCQPVMTIDEVIVHQVQH